MRSRMAEREAPLRYPIRGIFVGCCADAEKLSASSITQRAKPPSFRLFIFPHASHLSRHGCACFVPEPPQNIHLPLSNKKQPDLEMVKLSCQCSVLVRSDLTLNQQVGSSNDALTLLQLCQNYLPLCVRIGKLTLAQSAKRV